MATTHGIDWKIRGTLRQGGRGDHKPQKTSLGGIGERRN